MVLTPAQRTRWRCYLALELVVIIASPLVAHLTSFMTVPDIVGMVAAMLLFFLFANGLIFWRWGRSSRSRSQYLPLLPLPPPSSVAE